MKNTPFLSSFFILFAFLSLNITLQAQVDLDKGQIGYWPFDSSGLNKSINRLPQTDLQMYKTSYSKGFEGGLFGAPYFYGTSYGRINHGLQSKYVTFSIWFNTDAAQKECVLLGWDKAGYGISMKLGGKINVFLHITNNMTYTYDHDMNLADGHWHHVVSSFDGETFKVYIDGEKVRQDNQYGPVKTVLYELPGFNIGGQPKDVLTRCYTGLLDELMIFNRSLTEQEVEILAAKGKVVADDDLENPIIYLPFEENVQNLSPSLFESTQIELSGGNFANSCNLVSGKSMRLFNGNGDYLSGSSIFEIPYFTLSFWMSTYSAKESFITGWDTTGYRIILNPKGKTGKIQAQLWVSKKDMLILTSTSESLNDGQCHHIALSFDGQMCRLYIDTNLQDEKKVEILSNNKADGVFHAASTFLIGSERELNPQIGFQGKLDEVRLYNRSLNKNEIKKLAEPQTPVTLQYHLYDTQGISGPVTYLAVSNLSAKSIKVEVRNGSNNTIFSQKLKTKEHILKTFPFKVERKSVRVIGE